MNDRPAFDITSLLKDPQVLEEPYDATGAVPSPVRVPRRDAAIADSISPPSLSEDPPQVAGDPINPAHYRSHPSGIECIEITRHMNFNIGNSIKYLWRYMDKGDPIENLQKAQWYIDDEIRRLQGLR